MKELACQESLREKYEVLRGGLVEGMENEWENFKDILKEWENFNDILKEWENFKDTVKECSRSEKKGE